MTNRCISAANHCLYGITEAAILAAGYSPAIAFIHSGAPLSFVYDIADLFKFQLVTPIAFQTAKKAPSNPEREIRHTCRSVFREARVMQKLIPLIEEMLAAGGESKPTLSEGKNRRIPIEFDGVKSVSLMTEGG